jgi:transposase
MYCGVDVGKGRHHVCALDRTGAKVVNRSVSNDEAALREVFAKIARGGRPLIVVDQINGCAALTLAVARDMGLEVVYLPGLTMRRLADLHPGRDKTDARDAFVIADAGRTLPHTLRPVDRSDLDMALLLLTGFDRDLAYESGRVASRLRAALLHIHPALERLLGPRISKVSVLNILATAPTPEALQKLGVDGIAALMSPYANVATRNLPEKIITAVEQQIVEVPGSAAFGRIIASLAGRLLEIQRERKAITAELKEKTEDHPVAQIVASLPGMGVNGTARLLVSVGDARTFRTADQLAAYAGLAPVTRQSGTSLNSRRAGRGNRNIKNVFFHAAMASILNDPVSRAYYQRKRAEGKSHSSALVALARRKVNILHAMLRTGTRYQPPADPPEAAPDPGRTPSLTESARASDPPVASRKGERHGLVVAVGVLGSDEQLGTR